MGAKPKVLCLYFCSVYPSLLLVAVCSSKDLTANTGGFCPRINGHPGNYKRIAGWRLEEVSRPAEFSGPQRAFLLPSAHLRVLQCHPSGCLTDLFIQMSVIMLLKQTLNNIFEFTVPWVRRLAPTAPPKAARCISTYSPSNFLSLLSSWVKNCLRRSTVNKLHRKCGRCYQKACRDESGCVEPCDICKRQDWLRNYHLANTDAFSLFNEFLEMGKASLSRRYPYQGSLWHVGILNCE